MIPSKQAVSGMNLLNFSFPPSAVFSAYKWYLKQNKQDDAIKQIKVEQTILTQGVLACLKGLKEQGCDGPVTHAIIEIEKYLNKQAHR